MIIASLVAFILDDAFGNLKTNDSKHDPHENEKLFKSLSVFASLYGVASIAIGTKTLYGTFEQEKNLAEKNIVTKLIHNLKKIQKKKRKMNI